MEGVTQEVVVTRTDGERRDVDLLTASQQSNSDGLAKDGAVHIPSPFAHSRNSLGVLVVETC